MVTSMDEGGRWSAGSSRRRRRGLDREGLAPASIVAAQLRSEAGGAGEFPWWERRRGARTGRVKVVAGEEEVAGGGVVG